MSEQIIKVSPHIYKIIKMICKEIKKRKVLQFYYESESSGRKEWRRIRPYMIIPNGKESFKLVGLPTEQLKAVKRQPGHYLLERLDMERFEILEETFSDPGVPRKIVDDTKTEVICRFIYDDEIIKEVKKSWIKISK